MTQDAPISLSAAEEQRAAELREAQFTRKLVLAVLSTLQHKGILKAAEVDALLLAARRSANASVTAAPQAQDAQPSAARPSATQPSVPSAGPMKIRAAPARPIALHTQPPAPAALVVVPPAEAQAHVADSSELPGSAAEAASEQLVPVSAVPAQADEIADARRPRQEEKDGSKAPPIFDMQID